MSVPPGITVSSYFKISTVSSYLKIQYLPAWKLTVSSYLKIIIRSITFTNQCIHSVSWRSFIITRSIESIQDTRIKLESWSTCVVIQLVVETDSECLFGLCCINCPFACFNGWEILLCLLLPNNFFYASMPYFQVFKFHFSSFKLAVLFDLRSCILSSSFSTLEKLLGVSRKCSR